MQTNITSVNEVEFDFEITIPADELTPYIESKLKQFRPKVKMNGFRPGKVPAHIVKKMYGDAAALEVADKFVQDTYEEEVVENPEFDLLGRPSMTVFEYQYGTDLKAVIRFGVRPVFELKSLEGEKVSKLINAVTDEDVDTQIEYLRSRDSELVDDETGVVGEKSVLKADIQGLHPETKAPFADKLEEDGTIVMNDPNLLPQFRDALLGKAKGDVIEVSVAHNHAEGEGHDHEHHVDVWEVTIKEVQTRILPDLDEAFIEKVSFGEAKNEEELRAKIREGSAATRDKRSREMLQNKLVDRVLKLHAFEVPNSILEVYLDSFVKEHLEETKKENGGSLPAHFSEQFNEQQYRDSRYMDALSAARWMAIREAIEKEHDLKVTKEDLDAHFEEMAAEMPGVFTGETLREMYETNFADGMKQIEGTVLTNKVLKVLENQATVVEKSRADFETEQAEEKAAQQAEQEARIQELIAQMQAEMEASKAASDVEEGADADGIEDAQFVEITNDEQSGDQDETEEAQAK
jgi:trigger factor